MSRHLPMRTAFILSRKKAISIPTLHPKSRRKRSKEILRSQRGATQKQRHPKSKSRGLRSRFRKSIASFRPSPLEGEVHSKVIPAETARHILSKDEAGDPTYEDGYRAGCAVGVEEAISAQLPPYTLLANVGAHDIIAAGIQQYIPQLIPLLSPEEVYQRLENALSSKQPLSVVRLGDGELLALAHETVLPVAEAQARGPFLSYAGITLPDAQSRELLAESIKNSGIIGIPLSRLPSYQGLLTPVFYHYGIQFHQVVLTSSTINYALLELGLLQQLLQGRRVLLVGNMAGELANVLSTVAVNVAGIITPVKALVTFLTLWPQQQVLILISP